MFYKLELTKDARLDLDKISRYLEEYGINRDKIIKKINEDMVNLKFMPRIHKTVIASKKPEGEYRRIVSGKYIIIYQIENEKINILRVFSEKQNYLNSKTFELKEDSQKYVVIK